MPGPVATFYPVPADVWSEFRRLAGLSAESVGGLETHDADPELTAFEGETKIGFVLQRKREAWLRAAKISAALAASADGRLCCEVPGCGFDFESVYGDIGRDFAEVHHLMPLSDMSSPTVTRLEDLAVVCSNCHRMIHRGGGNRSMTGLIK
jgi:predicted HNH restriction endonuclease